MLDVHTVLVMEIAAALLVAVILPSARDARAVPGLRAATWGALAAALAFLPQLLRDRIPVGVALFVGNSMLWTSCALNLIAFRRVDEPAAPARATIAATLALSAGLLPMLLLGAPYAVRAIYASLAVGSFTGAGAWALLRRGGLRRERSRVICAGLSLLTSACMAARVVLLLRDPDVDPRLLVPNLERSVAFFPVLLYTMGIGLGLLMLHRERSDARSRELAMTDPLTGCANRRALEQRARGEVDHARRSGRPLAVIVADIDRFKAINDAHGHAAGDAVIRHVGALLQGGVRTSDVVARCGGEEFCLVLRDADLDRAAALAERLRVALRAAPIDAGATALPVTASFGVAQYAPPTDPSWDALFKRADDALYRAKQGGRDRVERG